MPTFAVNTAGTTISAALFLEKKLLVEIRWKGKSDETEKLLPAIARLLKKAGITYKKLDRIIVVSGPGPFSALRIGVSVANALSFALKIPVFSIDAKTLWRLRAPRKETILLVSAGGNFVARNGGSLPDGIFEIKKALDLPKSNASKSLVFFGDITAAQMAEFKKRKKKNWKFVPESRLPTFGETLLKLKPSMLKKENAVAPKYWRPPNITSRSLI